MTNLVGKNGKKASLNVIGKAEHLKLLLIEYMFRNNGGDKGYYSKEVKYLKNRRTWRRASFWKSDYELEFHPPVPFKTGKYAQNEFFYVGSTTSRGNGKALVISNITITGRHSRYFKINKSNKQSYVVKENRHLVLKVSYSSSKNIFRGKSRVPVLDAAIEFKTNGGGNRFQRIPIVPLHVQSKKRKRWYHVLMYIFFGFIDL